MADFWGCDGDEIVFGANMTSLTFAFSRAIGRTLQPGDEIVVTGLDHDANITPWMALADMGAVIRTVDINRADCTLDRADLARQINERTKVVAVTYASNAVGSITDVAQVVQLAHAIGAMVWVDAVHYAPHGVIDVRALDYDFLVGSAYKFFGPHVGVLYGKREHLARLQPYKVRSAPETVPSRWETGTQNHEGLAGLSATIHYLTKLGQQIDPLSADRRTALVTAMTATQEYEQELCTHLMANLLQIPGITVYGITDPARFAWRTPTIALRMAGYPPAVLAKALGDRGIFTWSGNFYARTLTERLGVEATGGFLRLGLTHYNTLAEVDRVLQSLAELAVQPQLMGSR
jgi:cysteine desulfurase family protein (TIGR01976 family)